MNDTTPLLHNTGYAPRASITWNGKTIGSSPASAALTTRWRVVSAACDELAEPAKAVIERFIERRVTAPQLVLALLGTRATARQADTLLLERVVERIRGLNLPAILPRNPDEGHAKGVLARGGIVVADLLTAVTLQVHGVGSLLLRDGSPNLSRIDLYVKSENYHRLSVVAPICLWLPPDAVRRIEELHKENPLP